MPKMKEKKKTGKKLDKKPDKKVEVKVKAPSQKHSATRDQCFDALVDLTRQYRIALGAALNDLDIYAGQEQLLLALHKSGALPPSQLAEILGVRPPTVTKMVSRLAANGLVLKTKQMGDGRMVVIALTDDGAAIMKQLAKRKKSVEKTLLAALSKPEIETLATLLQKAHEGQASN